MSDQLTIGGKTFTSRLMTGTGKHRSPEDLVASVEASGTPSEAASVMEVGADAVLVNTAIAMAADPALMGEGFRLGVQAGRMAYQAGRIPAKAYASASSPLEGVPEATPAD